MAIDYFGRTADMPPRPDDFAWKDHVPLTTFEGVRQDVAAAVAHLRSGDPERSIVTIGFCFGGSNSWHQAANGLGVSGAIGFYGNPVRRDVPQGAEPLTDRAQDMDCPVLGLMAGEDPGIPIEAADAFRSALAFAGVSHDIVVYPGAPHSFFDRASEQYAAESADAWKRVQAFIGSVA